MADEDIVLDLDTLAYEGVTLDLAVPTNDGPLLNLHEGSDFGVLCNGASIEINELGES